MTGTKKGSEKRFSIVFTIALICLMTLVIIPGVEGTSSVNLGSAGNFVILAKSAIDDTPVSNITGNVGMSTLTGSSITGLTCPEVTGTIYTIDAAGPACRVVNPGLLATAANDMQTAYTDAIGRTNDTSFNTAGTLSGTVNPGVYYWNGALNTEDVTLSGNSNDVWIFQVNGALTSTAGTKIFLSGGAQAQNVFWVVESNADTTLGANSVFNGNILDSAAITLNNGATLNGRALAQSAVTLTGANTISAPASAIEITVANVPVDALSLRPHETATNNAIEYFINSSSNWQVVASDGSGGPGTIGYMTNYTFSPTPGYVTFPLTQLSQPFMVQNSGSDYVALSTTPVIMTGTAEISRNTYNLGISQDSKYSDPVLPGTNVYHITVILTATNIP